MPEALTWNQIKNWWPILIATIGIAMFLGVMNYKIDTLIALQKESSQEFKEWKAALEDRVGKYAIRISVLESKEGMEIK